MICRACGAEVRFGWRGAQPGWWHREDLDHPGDPIVPEEVEEVEALPPVEVPCHPVPPKDGLIPGGARTILNLLPKHGWELRRLTHSRGPYVGSKKVLGISDSIVLGAVGPRGLDGVARVAVASWRDGKYDFGYIGTAEEGKLVTEKANATELKDWIKSP